MTIMHHEEHAISEGTKGLTRVPIARAGVGELTIDPQTTPAKVWPIVILAGAGLLALWLIARKPNPPEDE